MPSTSNPVHGLAEATKALNEFKQRDASKIVVRFKATGSAPIMKQNFFKITASNRFQAVIAFLRKELAFKPSDPVFLYINSSFSPAPDETAANLFKCFSTDGHLIVNYSNKLITDLPVFCSVTSVHSFQPDFIV